MVVSRMKSTELRVQDASKYPTFDLEYYIDQEASPVEVTVCSTETVGTIATEWITVDLEHAIPVEDIQ